MFCGECGTKNEKSALFCEKCGSKLEVEETVTKEVVPRKPMSKKTKIIISVVAVVLVVLIGVYMYVGSLITPEKIALKYFKAYANNDAKTLFSTINLEESKFVSEKLLKESIKDNEKIKLANYSVKKEDEKEDALSTSVTITYVEEGSSKEKTKNIKLTKNKKKKWLFFDNWTVDSSELVAKDYVITVPKDTTIEINGNSVSDKYREDSYSSYYDSYKIPSILRGKYDLTVNYDSGIKLVGELKINSNFGSYRTSGLKLEEKTSKKLEKEIKEKLELLYKSAMEDKSFDDIKESFNEDIRSDIESTYSDLKSNANSEYNKLKEINIDDIEITSVSVDEELKLTVKMKYSYKLEYKYSDETKEYIGKNKIDSLYVNYTFDKKDYVMSDISSILTYFSRY